MALTPSKDSHKKGGQLGHITGHINREKDQDGNAGPMGRGFSRVAGKIRWDYIQGIPDKHKMEAVNGGSHVGLSPRRYKKVNGEFVGLGKTILRISNSIRRQVVGGEGGCQQRRRHNVKGQ